MGEQARKRNDGRIKYDESVWEEIHRNFRLGKKAAVLSKLYGPSKAAIYKRSRKEGWVVDARDEVLTRTAAKLISSKAIPNQSDIEMAVRENVAVIREHRVDICKSRLLVNVLFKQLTDTDDQIAEIEETILKETESDKSPRRKNKMLAAVSLSSRSRAANDLSNALSKLIILERQAFNLDHQEDRKAPHLLSNQELQKELDSLNSQLKRTRAQKA